MRRFQWRRAYAVAFIAGLAIGACGCASSSSAPRRDAEGWYVVPVDADGSIVRGPTRDTAVARARWFTDPAYRVPANEPALGYAP